MPQHSSHGATRPQHSSLSLAELVNSPPRQATANVLLYRRWNCKCGAYGDNFHGLHLRTTFLGQHDYMPANVPTHSLPTIRLWLEAESVNACAECLGVDEEANVASDSDRI